MVKASALLLVDLSLIPLLSRTKKTLEMVFAKLPAWCLATE